MTSNRRVITPNEWKDLARSSSSDFNPEDYLIVKSHGAEVVCEKDAEDPSKETRIATFVASTDDRDRHGDRVMQSGWDLKEYRKNPVILWSHVGEMPPIGKALKAWKEDGKLKIRMEFVPREIDPFGYMIWEMVREGYLRANSVGFVPTKWKDSTLMDGESEDALSGYLFPTDFQKQKLLEDSVCTVPANPAALIEARGKNIDLSPMKTFAEKVLDNEIRKLGPYLTRAWVEAAHEVVDERKPVTVDLSVDDEKPGDNKERNMNEDRAARVQRAHDAMEAAKAAQEEYKEELFNAITDAAAEVCDHIGKCLASEYPMSDELLGRLHTLQTLLDDVIPSEDSESKSKPESDAVEKAVEPEAPEVVELEAPEAPEPPEPPEPPAPPALTKDDISEIIRVHLPRLAKDAWNQASGRLPEG